MRIKGTLHEDPYTFFIIFSLFLLTTRNVSDQSCRENHNTHFMFKHFSFENGTVYEIMRKFMVEAERPQMTKTTHAQFTPDT